MYLADTSAWSLLLRRPVGAPRHPSAQILRDRLDAGETVVLTGIVYQELLQGFRVPRERDALVRKLAPFRVLRPTRKTHEGAAVLRDTCLGHGVTVSTIDALIAQTSIDSGCTLITADADFVAVAKHSSLRLA